MRALIRESGVDSQFDSLNAIAGVAPLEAVQLFNFRLLVSAVVPASGSQVGALVDPSVTAIFTLIVEPLKDRFRSVAVTENIEFRRLPICRWINDAILHDRRRAPASGKGLG
jgi:hypothetical protein